MQKACCPKEVSIDTQCLHAMHTECNFCTSTYSAMLPQVPGFTHPVTDMYLEDILKLIGYQDALLGSSSKTKHLSGHSKSQHAGRYSWTFQRTVVLDVLQL